MHHFFLPSLLFNVYLGHNPGGDIYFSNAREVAAPEQQKHASMRDVCSQQGERHRGEQRWAGERGIRFGQQNRKMSVYIWRNRNTMHSNIPTTQGTGVLPAKTDNILGIQ